MSNMYESGSYLIRLFDKHGTYIKKVKGENLTQSIALGEELTSEPPAASFVVTRTVHNSLDRSDPWSKRA